MARIKIIKPGLLTTVQDRGRFGFQKFGVPVSGAMDSYSHRIANLLAGNDEYESVLEITLSGPQIEFLDNMTIALTGGNLTPTLNGLPLGMWQTINVSAGDIMTFGKPILGCRSYLAFSGGIDVPYVMGSKSTYLRGGFGGYNGRALASGDILEIGSAGSTIHKGLRKIPDQHIPNYPEIIKLRVIMGPQDQSFTKEGIQTFLSSRYLVTNESDRMGYRLDGPEIAHVSGSDIISDAIAYGSIQVPGHGMPIIMMSDRQTVGGYTKIATIVSVDLSKVAQAKPGNKILFEEVSINEAHQLLKQEEQRINSIKHLLADNIAPNAKVYDVKVNNVSYRVIVEEISD